MKTAKQPKFIYIPTTDYSVKTMKVTEVYERQDDILFYAVDNSKQSKQFFASLDWERTSSKLYFLDKDEARKHVKEILEENLRIAKSQVSFLEEKIANY